VNLLAMEYCCLTALTILSEPALMAPSTLS
jgi:hypothetical protein